MLTAPSDRVTTTAVIKVRSLRGVVTVQHPLSQSNIKGFIGLAWDSTLSVDNGTGDFPILRTSGSISPTEEVPTFMRGFSASRVIASVEGSVPGLGVPDAT